MNRYLLLVASALIVMGQACSSTSPDDSYTNTSTKNGGTVTTTTLTPAQPAITSCNKFTSSSGAIDGKVKSIPLNTSSVKVHLSFAPTAWAGADDVFIEFYLWGVTPSGTVVQNSTPWRPLQFRLEKASNGANACPTSGTSGCYFGWNPSTSTNVGFNRVAFASILGGVSNPSQLTEFNFVVTGTSIQYQVLRLQLTHVVSGVSSVIEYVDYLLPDFEANPNVYDDTHAALLNGIHPMWSMRDSGWTSQIYWSQLNTPSYCF